MGKSDRNKSTSKVDFWETQQDEFDSESIPSYNLESKSVKIRSLRDATTKYTGQVTGKRYQWDKAGDIVEVDTQDSEYLLALRGNGGCCGNPKSGRILFEVVAH